MRTQSLWLWCLLAQTVTWSWCVLYVHCKLPHLHGELIVNRFGKSLVRDKDNTCSATVFIVKSQGSISPAHQLVPQLGSSSTAWVLGDC